MDNTVKLTGNQTIAGVKTFSSLLYFNRAGEYGFRGTNSNVTLHDPSKSWTNVYRNIAYDRNGEQIASRNVFVSGGSNPFTRHDITAYAKNANGDVVTSSLRVYAYENGDTFATLPMRSSPGSSDIVNTKYVLDRVDEIVDYTEGEFLNKSGGTLTGHLVFDGEERKRNIIFNRGSTNPTSYEQLGDIIFNDESGTDILHMIRFHHGLTYRNLTFYTKPLAGGNYRSIFSIHDGYTTTIVRDNPGNLDVVNYKQLTDAIDAVTKAQVGLGAYPESPADIPISTATQNALNGKKDNFALYEHTIRITCTSSATFGVSLTVLNQSATPFTLPTLRDYLGSSADDYKQCSGVGWDGGTIIDLIGIRGGDETELYFQGVNRVTGDPYYYLSYDWSAVTVLLKDKVRQIL